MRGCAAMGVCLGPHRTSPTHVGFPRARPCRAGEGFLRRSALCRCGHRLSALGQRRSLPGLPAHRPFPVCHGRRSMVRAKPCGRGQNGAPGGTEISNLKFQISEMGGRTVAHSGSGYVASLLLGGHGGPPSIFGVRVSGGGTSIPQPPSSSPARTYGQEEGGFHRSTLAVWKVLGLVRCFLVRPFLV